MGDFINFGDFIQNTVKATHVEHARTSSTAIAPPTAFEHMRNHVLALYQGVTPSHSFLGDDGQYVDCIPVDQQPGLKLVAGGFAPLAAAPAPITSPAAVAPPAVNTPGAAPVESVLKQGKNDRFGNRQICPAGSIPMRRITLEEMTRFVDLDHFFRKAPLIKGQAALLAADAAVHRYAHAYQFLQCTGGSSWLNLWNPVPADNNFSLCQHWYVGGAGTGLQTVEGGWQVYPTKYGTSNAVLFIYWTADGYNQTGNYNLDKPAFVQVNNTWVIGGAFNSYSVAGGLQREFLLHWQRDASNGNWWLFLQGDAASPITAIGYYPQHLYGTGQLTEFATEIDYGGEVTGTPSGQMGSGAYAAQGLGHSCYQRGISYFPISGPAAWASLTPDEPSPACYTIDLHNITTSDWATYFYFGGPGCSS